MIQASYPGRPKDNPPVSELRVSMSERQAWLIIQGALVHRMIERRNDMEYVEQLLEAARVIHGKLGEE